MPFSVSSRYINGVKFSVSFAISHGSSQTTIAVRQAFFAWLNDRTFPLSTKNLFTESKWQRCDFIERNLFGKPQNKTSRKHKRRDRARDLDARARCSSFSSHKLLFIYGTKDKLKQTFFFFSFHYLLVIAMEHRAYPNINRLLTNWGQCSEPIRGIQTKKV